MFYKNKSDLYRSIVEKHTKIKLSKPTRQFDYVFARSCYYYLCRSFGEMSFAKISATVEKNHATVMHSLKELPYIIKHDNQDLIGTKEATLHRTKHLDYFIIFENYLRKTIFGKVLVTKDNEIKVKLFQKF